MEIKGSYLFGLIILIFVFTCVSGGYSSVRLSRRDILANQVYQRVAAYYAINGDKIPLSFDDLREVDSGFDNTFSDNILSQFTFIEHHAPLQHDSLKGWRLILISRFPIDHLDNPSTPESRYLIYLDENGVVHLIEEEEGWFKRWIDDAIPGITFGIEESLHEGSEGMSAQDPEPSEDGIVPPSVAENEGGRPDSLESIPPVSPEEEPKPGDSSNWMPWMGVILMIAGVGAVILMRRR